MHPFLYVGIAPAILIFAVVLQAEDPILRVLLPSAVAVSGMVRLARFKAKDPLRGQAGYAGLPITADLLLRRTGTGLARIVFCAQVAVVACDTFGRSCVFAAGQLVTDVDGA